MKPNSTSLESPPFKAPRFRRSQIALEQNVHLTLPSGGLLLYPHPPTACTHGSFPPPSPSPAGPSGRHMPPCGFPLPDPPTNVRHPAAATQPPPMCIITHSFPPACSTLPLMRASPLLTHTTPSLSNPPAQPSC